MNHQTFKGYARLVVLCGLLAVALGCGEDNPVAGTPEIDLATFTMTGSSTGATAPAMPAYAALSFGVESDPPDPSTDYPEPMFFEDDALSKPGDTVAHSRLDTADFGIVAGRLVDGIDEYIFYGFLLNGSSSSGIGSIESTGLDYAPGLARSGPDLAGYSVTSIVIELDELSITQVAGGNWKVVYALSGTIRGHKRD